MAPIPFHKAGFIAGVQFAIGAGYFLDKIHPHPFFRELTEIPIASGYFWEVQAFLLTVVVAYVYAWRRGVFRWR